MYNKGGDKMEHITDIDKTAHIEECVEAVREIINPDDYGLTEEALYALTKEIMDTSLTMGGDFHLDNIRFFAERFIKSGSIARFKMAHENDF